jgi:hypothetical protein
MNSWHKRTRILHMAPLVVLLALMLVTGWATAETVPASPTSDPTTNAAEIREADPRPGYAIVTTSAIAWQSDALVDFITHKQSLGFRVVLVMQVLDDDLDIAGAEMASYGGGTDYAGRPHHVRDWLKENKDKYNIQFVLLIGNPTPLSDQEPALEDAQYALPMLQTYPLVENNREYLTDHYFADLEGEWDWDEDNKYADPDDYEQQGVNFTHEVLVGRIPVYSKASECCWELDEILWKTIKYERSPDRSWRRSALMAMGFLEWNDHDTARLANAMREDYLNDAGVRPYTFFEQEGHRDSDYVSNESLTGKAVSMDHPKKSRNAVPEYWRSHPTGLLILSAHAGHPEYVELLGGEQPMGSSDFTDWTEADHWTLQEKPAIAILGACSLGGPRNRLNLGYQMLLYGAVGVVAPSQYSYYTTSYVAIPDAKRLDQNSIIYFFSRNVVNNLPIGKALFAVKTAPDPNSDSRKNALGYNLYGDPSIRLGLPLSEVVDLGTHHTCGLTPDGTIRCWGDNDLGQVEAPVGTFIQVSAGGVHSCGLRPDGSVNCWGSWAWVDDQVGPFTQISTGSYFACGLRSDGKADCWGYKAEDRDGPFTQISSGLHYTCGIRSDGTVECWSGDLDDLGGPDGPVTQVSTGWWHACGLRTDASIDCWGSNTDSFGSYLGQAEDRAGPFVQVAAGGFHTCGLLPNGEVQCWGSNGRGQLAPPENHAPFTQISAGYQHTCGLENNGDIKCWGSNSYQEADSMIGPFASNISDGNVIVNYSFETGESPWRFHNDMGVGVAGLSDKDPYVGDKAIEVTIGDVSSNMQLYQKGIALEPDTTYELSFAAYSNDARDMRILIHQHESPYVNYGLRGWRARARLESDWITYRYTFTTPKRDDMSNARLRFWFVKNISGESKFAQPDTIYHIDHIVLRPIYYR